MPIQINNLPLKIVLITEPGEVEFYSDVITRNHYLESSAVNRNTIIHVARRGREDVAVLTWEPGVRRWFSMRDRLIGWTASQREQRLRHCIENRRFLMLKEVDISQKVDSGRRKSAKLLKRGIIYRRDNEK